MPSSLQAPFTGPLGCWEVLKHLLETLLDSVNSFVSPANHMVRLIRDWTLSCHSESESGWRGPASRNGVCRCL